MWLYEAGRERILADQTALRRGDRDPGEVPEDDNVTVARMLRFSAALPAAGKPHTALPLSGSNHVVTQEETAAHPLVLERDFPRKSLGR